MERIFTVLVPLSPNSTILAVPCLFQESHHEEYNFPILYLDRGVEEVEVTNTPVIHLVLSSIDVIAKGFPVTILPVHVHLDSGPISYSKTAGQSPSLTLSRPSVLRETLDVGDSICAASRSSRHDIATFSFYLFTESKSRTFGLTCGHFVEHLGDTSLEPFSAQISSPPLAAIQEQLADMIPSPEDELGNVHKYLNVEGKTNGRVKTYARRVAQDLVKHANYNLICKEPMLLQVGEFYGGEVGHMPAGHGHSIKKPSSNLPSASIPSTLKPSEDFKVADWSLFEFHNRCGYNPEM